MKNHWIKRKEDREDIEYFKKKLMNSMNFSDGEWHHVSIQFDGTSSSVHIDDDQIFERALNDHEVRDLYSISCWIKDESGFYK